MLSSEKVVLPIIAPVSQGAHAYGREFLYTVLIFAGVRGEKAPGGRDEDEAEERGSHLEICL